MRKKLYEDVETVYKVISVIFPDEEEIEEFGSKEDAMEYAQEQISSEYYNEVIVSEVTIDEDGYEDETILLDEQSESKSNAYYALHTFYEDEPDEIDIDSLEVFESEEEAMKRAKELEAKGLRVVINIEGDESAGWDSEEYEYSDIGDEIYSTPYIMEEDVKSTKKMRTEQDWEDELKNNASRTSQIIKKLQDILNREKPPYYPYPGNIKTYIDQIHYYFLKGDENEVNSWLNDAEKYIISKMEDAIKQRSMGIKIKDSDFDYGDDEDEDFEYPDSSERYFFRVYFHDENEEELFAVDDGGYDFEPSYNTEEEALEAMKKILKDPKVQADPEIAGCHSVFVPDTEDVREVEEETGYEEFEVVDWIDKEKLKESFKSNKGNQSEFQIECKFKDDPEWYELVGCDGIYYEIDEITNGELSKYEKHNPHEYVFPTKEIADKFASIVRKISRGYGITKVRVIENNNPGEALEEETSFKSKDKYSVLREALDRLDEEDNKGKKIKVRAQIKNLRSKLKESKTNKDLKEKITESKEDKTLKDFKGTISNYLNQYRDKIFALTDEIKMANYTIELLQKAIDEKLISKSEIPHAREDIIKLNTHIMRNRRHNILGFLTTLILGKVV